MAKKQSDHYVVCISNEGYHASLEPRKIYISVADAEAKKLSMLRVVDESGEDYLFPADRFVPVTFPRKVAEAISHVDAHR